MTISDIAKMAGVSSAAVSRYFNNGYLSEEKKAAIQRVVDVTGYRPSIQAQMLRTKKTKTIGVLIPKIDSSSMARVVAGIFSVLTENSYHVLLADSQNDPKKELEYLAVFDESRVDGVIMAGTVFSATHRKAMKKVTVPLVVVGQQIAGFNCIFHDDYHAFYDLTRLFIEKGKKNLGYISVTEKDRAVGELRYKAFCDALKEAGMQECREQTAIGSFTMASGYDAMGELMGKYPQLDGVICATDSMAVGATKWCRTNGIRIPEQLEIGGQGDSDIAEVCTPAITTIHYYYEESGSAAARRILELIGENEDGYTATRELKLGYQIIDRLGQKE